MERTNVTSSALMERQPCQAEFAKLTDEERSEEVTDEEMAYIALQKLAGKWRWHRLGSRWLPFALAGVFILYVICGKELSTPRGSPHEVPAYSMLMLANETDNIELRMQATGNILLPELPASGEVSTLTRLHYFERRVIDSYLRMELALARSSYRPPSSLSRTALLDGVLRNTNVFKPLLSPKEKAYLLLTFEAFAATCQKAGLTYFLLDSSLLGSFRHHGIIPWSDVSVTVGMHSEERERALHVLSGMSGFQLMWPNSYSWTLRPNDFRPHPPDLLRTTFVRIRFFHENATHLWDETWNGKPTFTSAKRGVFPLLQRPFEGLLVPAPCDILSIIKDQELTTCHAVMEDFEELVFRDAGVVPCSSLQQVYPFVSRRLLLSSNSVLEQLSINGTLVHTIEVQTGCVNAILDSH